MGYASSGTWPGVPLAAGVQGSIVFRKVGVLATPAFRGAGGGACLTFENP